MELNPLKEVFTGEFYLLSSEGEMLANGRVENIEVEYGPHDISPKWNFTIRDYAVIQLEY